MTFSEVIEKVMHQVEGGSKESFLIFRDEKGEWHSDFTQNQHGTTFDWVKDIKDPFAVTITSYDIAGESYPYVYDRILNERLRAEYESASFHGADLTELKALMYLLEENVGKLSSEVTDYLTLHDRPLAVLYDMAPISLISNDPYSYYNYDKVNDFVEAVEAAMQERLDNRTKNVRPRIAAPEVQSEKSDKRVFDGYEEMAAITINRRLIFIGENKSAEHPYMIAEFTWNNPFNVLEPSFAGITDDYVEAMDEFKSLVEANINVVKSDLENRENLYGVEQLTLTAAECVPNGLNDDIEGKLIIIKPEALSPEYRRADYQLRVCLGGFGASPDSRGNAVYCRDLFDGKDGRFERYDVLGVADLTKLPQWAADRYSDYQKSKEPAKEPPLAQQSQKTGVATKKPTLQEKLDNAKQKAGQDAANKSNSTDKSVTRNTKKQEARE